ncbi:MAG TPA: hypothetical protein VLY83_04820 [Methanoregula sp.]|nr:hypothetical protein [Methanoregula sp.]
MTDYQKYTDEIPSNQEIQRWVAGYPNEELLIEIISRSYDYIRNLPLKGIHEDYCKDDECVLE